MELTLNFSSVPFSHSVVSNSVTPWTAVHHGLQAFLSIATSRSLSRAGLEGPRAGGSSHEAPLTSWIMVSLQLGWGVGATIWHQELWSEGPGVRPLHTAHSEQMKLDKAQRRKRKVSLDFIAQILFLFPGICSWGRLVACVSSAFCLAPHSWRTLRAQGWHLWLLPGDVGIILTPGRGVKRPPATLRVFGCSQASTLRVCSSERPPFV